MSLLLDIQRLTEKTYRQETGVNLEEFVIGRTRFRQLSRLAAYQRELSSMARVFLRIVGDRLYIAIYFHSGLIRVLENNDPRCGLTDKNITAFMIFIEEINHAIHAALKFLDGQKNIFDETFIRDLELQAKVDTYLFLKYFLAYFNKSGQLEMLDRLWLKFHVFETQDFQYESMIVAERYAEAVELGERFVRFIECLPVAERQQELNIFRSMNFPAKKKYIACLPN